MTSVAASSPFVAWLLVDAAMVRSTPIEAQLRSGSPDARALYADLGEDASAVGPWLLSPTRKDSLRSLSLPACLGVSEIWTTAPSGELFDHFKRIRHLRADDGQRFYFRFADTRALNAANRTLPREMLAAIKGPIEHWRWQDRHGQPCELGEGLSGTALSELNLTSRLLEALVAAGAADQMALSLEELGEPTVQPTRDPLQFRFVEEALAHCYEVGLSPWLLQRAVARQAVHSEGAALQDARFKVAVLEAKAQGVADSVDRWVTRTA